MGRIAADSGISCRDGFGSEGFEIDARPQLFAQLLDASLEFGSRGSVAHRLREIVQLSKNIESFGQEF